MMQVIVNGESRQFQSGISIADLLKLLKLNSRAMAVEVNQQLKPRDLHESTFINDGDVLEIVTLVGGG